MSLPAPLWYVDLLYTPVKNTSCCFPHQNWGPGGVGSCLLTQGGTGRAWPGTLVAVWWHCLLRGFTESCARGSFPKYLTQEHCFLQSSVPAVGTCHRLRCFSSDTRGQPRGLSSGPAWFVRAAGVTGASSRLLPCVKLCFLSLGDVSKITSGSGVGHVTVAFPFSAQESRGWT